MQTEKELLVLYRVNNIYCSKAMLVRIIPLMPLFNPTCIHVGHGEVDGLLPLGGDGQVDDSHVRFLEDHDDEQLV